MFMQFLIDNWYWLLLAIFILYGFSSEKKPRASKSASSSARIKISDYVPKHKDDDGAWCTPALAEGYLEKFGSALGTSEKGLQSYKRVLQEAIIATKEELEDFRQESRKECAESVSFFEKKIAEVENEILHDGTGQTTEEFQADIDENRDEIKAARKFLARLELWIDKSQAGLDTDCRYLLRALLAEAKQLSADYDRLPIDGQDLLININRSFPSWTSEGPW
jgi:hypothetical protein